MIYYWDIETTGIDAMTPLSRVTMIGIMDDSDQTTILCGESEKAILEDFWRFVEAHEGTYVGFNCLLFDFVYLYKRSIILGVKPYMPFKRMILDLRNALDSDKFAKGSLQGICMLINGEHKFDGLEGEDVIQLFYNRDYEKLKKYQIQDLILTKILYMRMKDCEVI